MYVHPRHLSQGSKPSGRLEEVVLVLTSLMNDSEVKLPDERNNCLTKPWQDYENLDAILSGLRIEFGLPQEVVQRQWLHFCDCKWRLHSIAGDWDGEK